MIDKWDERFIEMCQHIAQWSKDRSTKVGAVIVKDRRMIASGYNGFPMGVDDDPDERHERPAKYKWTEHAERNAIYGAAKYGIALQDSTIYIPWFSCSDCARAVIQSGIIKVVTPSPDFSDPIYGDDWKIACEMYREAGVEIKYYHKPTDITSRSKEDRLTISNPYLED